MSIAAATGPQDPGLADSAKSGAEFALKNMDREMVTDCLLDELMNYFKSPVKLVESFAAEVFVPLAFLSIPA